MKKEPIKNKKVTIDDLAIMIADGREETNELARMVAKGFESIDKRFNEVDKRFNEVDKRFNEVEESIQTVRADVLNLRDQSVSRYEFDDLRIRVVSLEGKGKRKSKVA